MIYADQRWIGDHGIGRFARNVLSRIDCQPICLSGHPAAPFDSYRLTRALVNLTHEDLFLSPGYNSPLLCPSPFVFTIHDLSHIYCRENSNALIRLYYRTILKRACHRARRILTVSEFTRGQVLEWSGLAPASVVNVSCGVDSEYRPDGERFESSFPYLLCVSNRKPHKNEYRLLAAFARSKIASDLHLILTGTLTRELAGCIAQFHLEERVHLIGKVPEAKLPALYRGARALVFVSLYEGFGLPLLEAMACGTPVITSNVTAMPEIAAGAACLVDPTSLGDIAAGIEQITGDSCLREELREKGLARAAQFSWERTAHAVRQALAASMNS
jgi:glycosyltransferase involved in cell wall biosynthesis